MHLNQVLDSVERIREGFEFTPWPKVVATERYVLALYTTHEMKNQTESWRSIKHLSSTKSTIQCRY